MTTIDNPFKAICYGLILGLALGFYCLYVSMLMLWLVSEILFSIHTQNLIRLLFCVVLMCTLLGALKALGTVNKR